jgi:hypothetical protein
MQSSRLSRREVIKFFGAVTAALALPDAPATAQFVDRSKVAPATGYGPDPDLTKLYAPGDLWPLTFTPAQREVVTTFGDVLLPADTNGPAASALRVPDYLDEWVSAPYPQQQKDRAVVIEGITWLEAEAQKRFQKAFKDLAAPQHAAICDDICWPPDAKPEFKQPAEFFALFRSLACAAYYGTMDGWKAIGYVGNVPRATFDGPPPEVLQKLGLEQTIN